MNIKFTLSKLKTDLSGIFARVLDPQKAILKLVEITIEQNKILENLKSQNEDLERRLSKLERKMKN